LADRSVATFSLDALWNADGGLVNMHYRRDEEALLSVDAMPVRAYANAADASRRSLA
jgi:hypothetical protein